MGALKCAMKQIFKICTLALLALALLAPVFSANAEQTTGTVTYTMELSNNRFSGPEEITVTIKVTNTADTDMPGPVALYYPDGNIVQEFGNPTLGAGQSQTWTGTWTVTQKELELGRLTFTLYWYEYNEKGELGRRGVNFSKSVILVDAEPSVEVNRIIQPSMAGENQEISVTYEIVNTGTVDITNITIRENSDISKSSGNIESVPAGQRASHTFKVKMGKKDLTSSATITYRAGNATGTIRKEAAVIKYGEVKLSASLASDKKGGVAGDTVKLTLTLKNTGSVDYQNITVTDALLGELFTGVSVPANKTVTLDKEVTITGSTDYQFVVTGQDASGAGVETASERVSIKELDPAKAINLSVEATADRETIYNLPGVVRFTVRVTNDGVNEVKNVSVAASGTTLYRFESIQPGETKEFTRDASLSMGGQYRFDASALNEIEERQTFGSNIIQIQYAQPTAAPTDAPIITPPAPVYEELPTTDDMPEYVNTLEKILGFLNHAFLILAGICLALLVVGVVRRIQANSRAKDHLERSSARVYDMPAPKDKRRKDDEQDAQEEQEVSRPIGEDNEPEVPEVEEAVEAAARDGALMEETLRQLYQRADRSDEHETIEAEELPDEEPEAVEVEPETEESDETPRRRRGSRAEEE